MFKKQFNDIWLMVPFVVICDRRSKIPHFGGQTPAEGMDFNIFQPHPLMIFDAFSLISSIFFNFGLILPVDIIDGDHPIILPLFGCLSHLGMTPRCCAIGPCNPLYAIQFGVSKNCIPY